MTRMQDRKMAEERARPAIKAEDLAGYGGTLGVVVKTGRNIMDDPKWRQTIEALDELGRKSMPELRRQERLCREAARKIRYW